MPAPIWTPLFAKIDELIAAITGLCECFGEGGGGGAMIINTYQHFFHDGSYFPTGHQGKFLLNGDEGHPYNFAMGQNDDADEWKHDLLLKAGVDYYGEMLCIDSANGGIMELRLGTDVLQTFDFYSPTTDYNINKQFAITGTLIPTDGIYELRGVTTGHNGSSTGYDCWITKVHIRPYSEA